jgi:hypothetical protein
MKLAHCSRYVGLLGFSTAAAIVVCACGAESERDPVADELTTQLQAELDAAATVNAATAASVRPVRPLLKCVDKLSSTSYRAHFGYSNSSTASIPIPVGFYNRFYPNPQGRGQPTTFLAGSHPDLLQMTFSSNSLAAWILGSSVVVATRTTSLCPTGTGGTTGTAGAGTGGRGGAGGVVGVGGSPGVGGAMCPSSCDDRNPCTTDICNASTAFKCSNVAARDGTVCDDGNNCTVSDQCVAGACVPGIAKVCNAIDQCHVAGVCDPTSGACSIPTIANGTPCNDGSLCTPIDLCQAGVCLGTMPKVCTASDQCHVAGVCAPSTGLCSNPTAADGTACNDGNACTIGDACRAGTCTPAQTLTASHCAGVACDQCSFDVGSDVCSLSPDGCNNCVASTDGCDAIADPTDRQLCEDAYGCFTDPVRNCVVQGDALGCWCGTNTATCDTDSTGATKANGPCLDFVTRAARLTPDTYDAASIEQRLIDPDFPLGRAVNLVNCRGTFCSTECGVR